MTEHITKPQPCAICKTKSDVGMKTFQTGGGRKFRLYCRTCGFIGDRTQSPAGATNSWNHHQDNFKAAEGVKDE